MPTPQENWQPVVLAAKVIGHISQGMYRTPASAIKELVSNAYDAGATYVKLHTGFPRFTEFSCEDDGSGIVVDEFRRLMNGGIGDSLKQTSDATRVGKNGRPIVGRLGVGLLSLAQICTRFRIISHHEESETAFDASIKFPPYTRQEIDKLLKEASQTKKEFIQTGEYLISEIPYSKKCKGTRVTTTFLRDTFVSVMSNIETLANLSTNKVRRSYRSFGEYLIAISDPALKSLHYASHYDQLIYGIAAASPIPYPEDTKEIKDISPVILETKELSALQQKLKSFDFRVELDSMELRRPLLLPSSPDGTKPSECRVSKTPEVFTFNLKEGLYFSEPIKARRYWVTVANSDLKFQIVHFDYEDEVNGVILKFSGYIFLQTKRLFPKEEQGLLVRLRHVAIGQHDISVMTYPLAEGPRFSMLSGEVFVERGLDDALKIDRDGFNTLDPHYVRLQSFLHSLLHQVIFPESWTEEKARNLQRREQKSAASDARFSSKMKETTGGDLKAVEVAKKRPSPATPLASIDVKTKKITIYRDHPAAKPILRKKKFRGIAAQVIAAFEVANRESSPAKRREVFYKLIEDVFDV